MASMNDLFGGGDKRPGSPKWNAPGDEHKGMIVEEPETTQQVQVNGNWEPQWLEKQTDGKWKLKTTSELTEGLERSALMQIVLTVKLLATGELATFYIDNKIKKDALKKAMEETGLDIGPGNGIMMRREPNVGKMFGWTIKLAAPKVKA